MFLRESDKQPGDTFDLGSVIDPTHGDSGVLHGAFLMAFVEAVITRDRGAMRELHSRGRELLGPSRMVDVAAVLSGFNGITRIADAIGIPLDPTMAANTVEMRKETGIDSFAVDKY